MSKASEASIVALHYVILVLHSRGIVQDRRRRLTEGVANGSSLGVLTSSVIATRLWNLAQGVSGCTSMGPWRTTVGEGQVLFGGIYRG